MKIKNSFAGNPGLLYWFIMKFGLLFFDSKQNQFVVFGHTFYQSNFTLQSKIAFKILENINDYNGNKIQHFYLIIKSKETLQLLLSDIVSSWQHILYLKFCIRSKRICQVWQVLYILAGFIDFLHVVLYQAMKKAQLEILSHIQTIDQSNNLLAQVPKTPQQQFLLTYAAIHFLNKGNIIPSLTKLLQNKNSSFTYIQLKLKYMKKCMEAKSNLDNPDFYVLSALIMWMEGLQKLNKNTQPKLVNAILLPSPQKLKFSFYEQFIVYLNYLAIDIQNLFKSNTNHWSADDILQLLAYALPRIHYNIILPLQYLGDNAKQENKQKTKDILFWNLSLQYITRVKTYYRSLMKLLIKYVTDLELKPPQMRSLVDLACRYYLLFWNDSRQQADQIFFIVFTKISEAVRFSLTDELLLFFKVCQKIGANNFIQSLRQKWQWVDSLLVKYGHKSVGHPKDEIYPFNSLKIRQKLTVEAGKMTQKILQIYDEYSLFYFSIQVQDLDINIKLYYLGDFQSNVEVKNLILTEDKRSQLNRFAFMATKRGLYKIEIDNSYSWIKSKKLEFEYVVLSQYRPYQRPNWFNNLFEVNNNNFKIQREENSSIHKASKKQTPKKQSNQVKQQKQIKVEKQMILEQTLPEVVQVKNQKLQQNQVPITNQSNRNTQNSQENKEVIKEIQIQAIKQSQKTQEQKNQIQVQKKEPKIQSEQLLPSTENLDQKLQVLGQANLSLIDNIFSLLVRTEDHTYEFQTNFEDRIIKRLRNYCYLKEKYQWIVNGEGRDWLKKQGFSLISKKGLISLIANDNKEIAMTKKQDKQ